jgi:teichoic acid transport system permease protein
MTQTAVESDTGMPLRELARKHGLGAAGRLPSLPEYTRILWSYRHFITQFAKARVTASLGETKLGMIWTVLTPLFNAGVYYVIFGVLMDTKRDQPNFIGYLCVGVFIFGFTQSVTQAGVTAITGHLGLIRALHFPRASLPIAFVIVEVRNMIASVAVLVIIMLGAGEMPSPRWLLIVPALLVQTVFNAGLAMLVARLGSKMRDLRQLIPFIMRIWMYGSAVIFPVTYFSERLHGWKLEIVEANPALVYVELVRHALMDKVTLSGPPLQIWIEAVCWALVMGIGGYTYFWRGEKGYGRG